MPGGDGDTSASVLGRGEGRVEGKQLLGTAETRIVASTVAGVDSRMPFIPVRISHQIVSTTEGMVGSDGSLTLLIHSEVADGDPYTSTVTRPVGIKSQDALPPVAAPPD